MTFGFGNNPYHRETRESDLLLPLQWFSTLVGLGLASLLIAAVAVVVNGPGVAWVVAAVSGLLLAACWLSGVKAPGISAALVLAVAVSGLHFAGFIPAVNWEAFTASAFCWPICSLVGLVRLFLGVGLPAVWFALLPYLVGRGLREIAWPGLSDAEVKPTELPRRSRSPFSDGRDWLEDEPEVEVVDEIIIRPEFIYQDGNGNQQRARSTGWTQAQWQAFAELARSGQSLSADTLSNASGEWSQKASRQFIRELPEWARRRAGQEGAMVATDELLDWLDTLEAEGIL